MASETDGNRSSRIDQVILDHLQRRHSGEHVSDEALIAEHPELMPQLADRLVEISELSPREASGDSVDGYDSSLDPRALYIRCPHCHQRIEVLADSDFEDITCSACGSQFSLAGESVHTREAPSYKQIGHFELVERLGLGSFGTVWKARDTELDRTVAVKIPRRGQLDPAQIEKFLREARAAAQLNHKNIARVYEVGGDGEHVYIVSELVRGVSLADWLTGRQPTFVEAAQLCAKLADALHHAHESGVIHRDLKPQNVMMDAEGEPHIMDFGLAKRETGEITMTLDGHVLGTPAYMSPEQARGEAHNADRRTDVYSLGAILFELLTGELPFRGNARMLIHQVLNDEPPSPRNLNSNVPRDLETICLKCLEKEPAKRYENADDVSADVMRFCSGEPIHARPIGTMARSWRWCVRNPMATTVAGLVLLLAVAGPLVAIRQSTLAVREAEAKQNALVEKVRADRAAFILAFRRGMTLCEQGQVGSGMLWLTHALEIAPDGEADMERVIRSNLNAWRQELHILQGVMAHSVGVVSCIFSPDGKYILSGSYDGTAQLWNADTGEPLGGPLRHEPGEVHDLAFSPDGTLMATVGFDRTARLWKTETRELVRVVKHPHSVTGVAFRSDREFATSTGKGGVYLWHVDEEDPLQEMNYSYDLIHDLNISPDGKFLAGSGFNNEAVVWRIADGKIVARFPHETRVPTVDFLGQNQLATGDTDGRIQLWTWATDDKLVLGRRVGQPYQHRGGVHRLRSNSDGSVFASASRDNATQILSRDGDLIRFPIEHPGAVNAVAFREDGSVVTACEDNFVRFWKTAPGPRRRIDNYGVGAKDDAVFTTDGRYVLVPYEKLGATVHDTLTGKSLGASFQPGANVNGLAVSPDGKTIATGAVGGFVEFWRAGPGEQFGAASPHKGPVYSLAFSSDGNRLVSGGYNGLIQVWNATTGGPLYEPHVRDVAVRFVAFMPGDNTRIIATTADKLALLIDIESDQVLQTFTGHSGNVNVAAISRDGTLLATGSFDNTVRIWDISAGSEKCPALRHRGPIWYALSFNDDGTAVVTGTEGGAVRVWDVATGQPIGPILKHQSVLKATVFSEDGAQVFTGTATGLASFWDVESKPLENDVELIKLWLQVSTGMELNAESGELRVRDVTTWRQLREQMQAIVVDTSS